jgi:hypothetical protein
MESPRCTDPAEDSPDRNGIFGTSRFVRVRIAVANSSNSRISALQGAASLTDADILQGPGTGSAG